MLMITLINQSKEKITGEMKTSLSITRWRWRTKHLLPPRSPLRRPTQLDARADVHSLNGLIVLQSDLTRKRSG